MKKFKVELKELLEKNDFENNIHKIQIYDKHKLVNALFSFLCSTDKKIKTNAVIAMGEVVSRIAETDLESARIIMRRLMLNLNDESGGIGWGAPEAMGEIMARSEQLANEYYKILISYTAAATAGSRVIPAWPRRRNTCSKHCFLSGKSTPSR